MRKARYGGSGVLNRRCVRTGRPTICIYCPIRPVTHTHTDGYTVTADAICIIDISGDDLRGQMTVFRDRGVAFFDSPTIVNSPP